MGIDGSGTLEREILDEELFGLKLGFELFELIVLDFHQLIEFLQC